jgi:hypothetical protein
MDHLDAIVTQTMADRPIHPDRVGVGDGAMRLIGEKTFWNTPL